MASSQLPPEDQPTPPEYDRRPSPAQDRQTTENGQTSDDPAAQRDAQPPAVDPHLLDQVVEETMIAGDADARLLADERAALHSITRELAPSQPTLAVVANQYVQVILAHRFAQQIPQEADRRSLARQIADALLDNELAAGRLERMWNRFCEATS